MRRPVLSVAAAVASVLATSVPAWAIEPDPGDVEASTQAETEGAARASSTVPDSTFEALKGRKVEVTRSDGSTVLGTLEAVDEATATLVGEDGRVLVEERAEIAGLRVQSDPASEPPPPVPPRPPVGEGDDDDDDDDDDGEPNDWATAGGVTGVSLAGVGFFLTIGSEVANAFDADREVLIPLGSTAGVLLIAATPIAAAGASSARNARGSDGSPGMRITGWILYGLSLATFTSLLGLGAAEIRPPPGVFTTFGALGLTAAGLMMGDGVASHRGGKDPRATRLRSGLRFAGGAGPRAGFRLGLSGRF